MFLNDGFIFLGNLNPFLFFRTLNTLPSTSRTAVSGFSTSRPADVGWTEARSEIAAHAISLFLLVFI